MSYYYCQFCGTPLTANQGGCPACGSNTVGSSIAGSAVVSPAIPTLQRRKIPVCLENATVVDRTASSQPFANATLLMVASILNGVSSKAAEVKCWLQSHGDRDYGETEILHSDGVQPKQLVEDLMQIEFAGGGDPAETHLDAIECLANTVPFTSNPRIARGVLLAFMTDDSKRLRSGKSPEQLGEELYNRGLLTYMVCEPRPRLDRFAQAAQALVIPINKNPSQDLVRDVVARVSASIVQTLSTGGTVPVDLNAGDSIDLLQTSAV
jgi:hypothetical protein